MGISGLIPFLEKASQKSHVKDLPKGTCVAIDTYCWLHKGAFACSEELARGEKTDVHINYCLKYVKMLLSYGIKPVLVFDGRHLPAKALTETKRRENRKMSRNRAAELMRLGMYEEARSHFRRCVDITHEMALQLIQECRRRNVDCIVAPYEADGQLAYLNRIGVADYVVTEDSDLTLFGCKKILFKLDLTGGCLFVDASKLHLAMGCTEERFNFEKFRFMCIMSGCDYLESLPGIGLAKACKFVMKTEDGDMRRSLSKIPSYLNMRHLEVSDEYKESFLRANATFQHMIVYDPRERKLVHLNDPHAAGTDMQHCSNAGEFFDDHTAFQLALGNLDPFTLKKLDDWSPDDRPKLKGSDVAKHQSMWNRGGPTVASKPPVPVTDSSDPNSPVQKCIKFRYEPKVDIPIEAEQVDLLDVYGRRESSQLAKRPKLQQFDPLEPTPNLSRNPFGVTKKSPSFTSPTKISAETSSLLGQCSPVKKIEFNHSVQISPVKRRLDSKFGAKLRLKRTVLDEKQKVLSRFFQTNSSRVTHAEDANGAVIKAEDTTLTKRVAAVEQLLEDRKDCVIYPAREEQGVSTPDDDRSDENDCNTVDLTSVDDYPHKSPVKPQQTLLRTKMIVDDVPQKSPVKSQKTLQRSNSTKVKGVCRQPGLSRASRGTPQLSDNTQSRLSMFGFKKKSI